MRSLVSLLFVCSLLSGVFAQEGGAPLPKPAPPMAPVPRADDHNVSKKGSEDINGSIVKARIATADGRYAESEALMLKVTQANPALILPWVELGAAQLGLKKFTDAET